MVGVTLKSATQGRFEVSLDEQPIFSKFELKRFPHEGEIEGLLEKRGLGPAIHWK